MKKITSWILVIVGGFVFVGYLGLGGMPSTGNATEIGTVNGKPILYKENSQLDRTYRQIINQYESQGMQVNEMMRAQMLQYAFNSVADQKLLENFAEKNDLAYSDAQMTETDFQFAKQGGIMTWEQYKEMLTELDDDIIRLRQEQAEQALLSRMIQGTYFFTAPVSQFEIQRKAKLFQYKKQFYFAYLDAGSLIEDSVKDSDLRAYYLENQSNYTSSYSESLDTVRIDYLNANAAGLSASIKTAGRQKIQDALSAGRFEENFFQTASQLDLAVYESEKVNATAQSIDSADGEALEFIQESLIEKLIQIPANESQILDTESGLLLAKVVDVEKPEDSVNLPSFITDSYKEEITSARSQRLQYAFIQSLRDEADIEYNFGRKQAQ